MTQTQERSRFSENAAFIAKRQYLQEGEETILDRFSVVAEHVANAEDRYNDAATTDRWADKFYDLMAEKKFCPGGRILAGAGTQHGQLLNCFQGDTIVETRDGPKPIRELSGLETVLSQDDYYRIAEFKSYGHQELYRVTFANGEVVETTAGHQWVHGKKRGGKYPRVPTTELLGKFVPVLPPRRRFDHSSPDFTAGVRHGIVYGDGSKNTDAETHYVRLFGEKRQLASYFQGENVRDVNYDDREQTMVGGLYGDLKNLPGDDASDRYWYGFFCGLMATDGHVDERGSSALFSSTPEDLIALSRHLGRFGVKHASIKVIPDHGGRYGPRPCYVMRLLKQTMTPDDFIRDDQRANFTQSLGGKQKNASLEVVGVEPTGRIEEVFCCEEPDTNTFVIQGGFLTGNCFVQGATEHEPHTFEGVMEIAKKLALVTKVGGGNGVNLDVFSAQTQFDHAGVRGVAVLNADHPDVLTFIKGLMTPSNQPDGEKVPTALKNFYKVVVYHPRNVIRTDVWQACLDHDVRLMTEDEALSAFGLFGEDDDSVYVPDDLGGIIEAAKLMCEQAKRGDRPVVYLNDMRGEGTPINGSGGTSSGPFSFLVEVFDNFLEWANRGAEKSGPINTLRYIFAPVLRVVRQGGTRRGAGMATIAIDNPHVLDFLTAKDLDREEKEGDISTFNISILVSEEFMGDLAIDNTVFVDKLICPPGKYDFEELLASGVIQDNQGGSCRVKAQWLWDQIAQHAWSTGEPGLIFVDRINEYSALKNLGAHYQIRSTNPCGEIPLTIGEPCDLGAINLAAYVKDGTFDWDTFRRDIHTAVRFLDDVLDVNNFPLEQNREASHGLRRLGLGVMGMADMLIKLGLRYDSEAGRDFVFRVMDELRSESILASEQLGHERGVYPVYASNAEQIPHAPRRNVAVLTVAPTGTTSMLFDVSSGLEPIFSLFVYRKVGADYVAYPSELFVEMMEQYDAPEAFARGPLERDGSGYAVGSWDWDKITEALSANHGSAQGLDWVPQEIRDVFVTAHDVAPLDHVRMQGAVQRAFDNGGYAGNSLSKTINLPNAATVADVQAAYLEAYATGCKGITVYRDGSRQFQVLSTSKDEQAEAEEAQAQEEQDALTRIKRDALWANASGQPALQDMIDGLSSEEVGAMYSGVPAAIVEAVKPAPIFPYARPAHLVGWSDRVRLNRMTATGLQKETYLVTVNRSDIQGPGFPSGPVEVILTCGKSGESESANAEALGRVVSIALQEGADPERIARTLRGIEGGLMGNYEHRQVRSTADLIAVAIEVDLERAALRDSIKVSVTDQIPATQAPEPVPYTQATLGTQGVLPGKGAARGERCRDCGEHAVTRVQGCSTCASCGSSKCG